MRLTLFILLLFLTCCRNQIDINSVELRKHGLSYIKGTNDLVDGEVVRKAEGKIVELRTYEEGKMIGPFFLYGLKGEVLSHGFGSKVNQYEKLFKDVDLANSLLSIVDIKSAFVYATLYIDNTELFNDKEKLIVLTKSILADYSKYNLDGLLIFDDNHQYSISKSATIKTSYTIDTIHNATTQELNFH